jgi:hypothetical protein
MQDDDVPDDGPADDPVDDPEDAAALAGYAAALAAALDATLPGWVERSVHTVLAAQGRSLDAAGTERLRAAVDEARADGMVRLRQLLATDVDRQPTNPLSIVRSLVRYPTAVLAAAGARPVPRDDFAMRNFPDDVYDLTPAAFADVDPSVHEPGLLWGAAKAHVHLARRRRLA